MSHTPGKWKYQTSTDSDVGYEVNSDENPWSAIADVRPNFLGSREVLDSEAEKNACLISAAPDLLMACKNLVSGMPDEYIDTHVRNLLDRLEEAIAKAEGNS